MLIDIILVKSMVDIYDTYVPRQLNAMLDLISYYFRVL